MFVDVKASDLRYCKTVVRRFRLLFFVIVSQYEATKGTNTVATLKIKV
jgi:hypothetical protein